MQALNPYHTVVKRSFLTEVQFTQVPGNGSVWKFGENPIFTTPEMMQNVVVYGVETIYDTLCPFAPTGRPSITQAGLSRCLISLKVGAKEEVLQYPGLYLCTLLNGGQLREFSPLQLNFSQCYVTVTDNAGPVITDKQSLLLNIIYAMKKDLLPQSPQKR